MMRNCADMPKTLAGQKKRGEGTAEEEKQKKQKKKEKKKEKKRRRLLDRRRRKESPQMSTTLRADRSTLSQTSKY